MQLGAAEGKGDREGDGRAMGISNRGSPKEEMLL
jgi:hypothetical protein